MDERAFAAAVAQQAALTIQEARDLSRATLEELGGQLSGGEIRVLATVLPNCMASNLPQHAHGSRPVPVSDFIRRLAQRTGLSRADVTHGVRAILSVLGQMPDSTPVRHALSQLPAAYRELAAITA
jgi:uncharacterized protein (DUF2267 family)